MELFHNIFGEVGWVTELSAIIQRPCVETLACEDDTAAVACYDGPHAAAQLPFSLRETVAARSNWYLA